MTIPVIDDELSDLLDALIEESITAEQMAALEARILSDQNTRAAVICYMEMQASLEIDFCGQTISDSAAAMTVAPKPLSMRWIYAITALAAAITLICSVAIHFAQSQPEVPSRGPACAKILDFSGAVFEYGVDGNPLVAESTILPSGEYTLKQGLAEIACDTGPTLIVEAPATFLLTGKNSVGLLAGKMLAKVPPHAHGFKIETKAADIIDHGTEFGVNVQQFMTDVHVYSGSVVVEARDDDRIGVDTLTLNSGVATRIFHDTGQPTGIDLAMDHFVRSLAVSDSPYGRLVYSLKPVVYFPMDSTASGMQLENQADNGSNAIIKGLGSGGARSVAGRIGRAMSFAGPRKNGYGYLPDYPKAQDGRLSVTAWVYAESRPRWGLIASNWTDETTGQFHFGLRNTSGELHVQVTDRDGEAVLIHEGQRFPLNEWQHVGFVADGTHLRLYRNGELVAVEECSGIQANTELAAMGIGVKLQHSNDKPSRIRRAMWHGRLDEIAVFNHALTDADVLRLYQTAP